MKSLLVLLALASIAAAAVIGAGNQGAPRGCVCSSHSPMCCPGGRFELKDIEESIAVKQGAPRGCVCSSHSPMCCPGGRFELKDIEESIAVKQGAPRGCVCSSHSPMCCPGGRFELKDIEESIAVKQGAPRGCVCSTQTPVCCEDAGRLCNPCKWIVEGCERDSCDRDSITRRMNDECSQLGIGAFTCKQSFNPMLQYLLESVAAHDTPQKACQHIEFCP